MSVRPQMAWRRNQQPSFTGSQPVGKFRGAKGVKDTPPVLPTAPLPHGELVSTKSQTNSLKAHSSGATVAPRSGVLVSYGLAGMGSLLPALLPAAEDKEQLKASPL